MAEGAEEEADVIIDRHFGVPSGGDHAVRFGVEMRNARRGDEAGDTVESALARQVAGFEALGFGLLAGGGVIVPEHGMRAACFQGACGGEAGAAKAQNSH